ncbi:MAG: sugar transferase [Candidatus Paceibacterota bacterium]|jgi:lipopolysaccharide/colanic/teichoic acid biosynthesis glycosyltransferase
MNKIRYLSIFVADLILFFGTLFLILAFRYGYPIDKNVISSHLYPFSIIFVFWAISMYIAGLYDNKLMAFRKKIPEALGWTMLTNLIFSVLMFYFLPNFEVAPKTNLFLFIFLLFVITFLWRSYIYFWFSKSVVQKAVIIGNGKEIDEVFNLAKDNPALGVSFVSKIDNIENLLTKIKESGAKVIVADFNDPVIKNIIPLLCDGFFAGFSFISLENIYENVFHKIPITIIDYSWFIENVSSLSRRIYDLLKRISDIFWSFVLGVLSLILYPFVYVAIKIEDKGPVFISQDRVGLNGKIIRLRKFRTMGGNEHGVWVNESVNKVTRVGYFLRKTRIDEFPQLWNVLVGDISLIGPRPDIAGLVDRLIDGIPYYKFRYIVKPGLTGWAQISQEKPPQSVEETHDRFAYDMFYIKNRGVIIDLKIFLRTIKTIISRSGM